MIDLSPHLEKQPYANNPEACQRVQEEMAKLGARAEAQPDGVTLYKISNRLRDRARDGRMAQFAAAAASAAPHVNLGPGGVNVVQTGDNNKVGNLSARVETDRLTEAVHAELVRLASDTRLRGFHQAQASSLAHAVETARRDDNPAERRSILARVAKFAADLGPIATLLSSLATAGHQAGVW